MNFKAIDLVRDDLDSIKMRCDLAEKALLKVEASAKREGYKIAIEAMNVEAFPVVSEPVMRMNWGADLAAKFLESKMDEVLK